MGKSKFFIMLLAGACSFTSVSDAAVVLTIDAVHGLLAFSGTTGGKDEVIVPDAFSVIEWGTSLGGSGTPVA